ncbi:MAG: hypothetical protein JO199_03090 [Candidatus Eremiobacteraeota bacterium]|nr:hypothetical protein [Candidatus Eremiobacteraeota bacterium]
MKRYQRLLGALLAATVAACSGNAGGTGLVPGGSTPTSNVRHGFVRATLHVPKHRHQSAREIAYLKAQQDRHNLKRGHKRGHYIPGNTTEVDFVVNTINGVAATPADSTWNFSIFTSDPSECVGNGSQGWDCSVTHSAPAGVTTYYVNAYQCSQAGTTASQSCASKGGTLTVLSTSYVTVSVDPNQTTLLATTLNPIVGSIEWSPVAYVNVTGPAALSPTQWLSEPFGTTIPTYTPSSGVYSCGSAAQCYEPAAKGVAEAFGASIQVRDPSGALIIPASGGGDLYTTPVFLDGNGNVVNVDWSCVDWTATNANLRSRHVRPHAPPTTEAGALTFEPGGGPYANSGQVTFAHENFNSPVVNPALDADGGNTTDGKGNPVTAVGNNGTEINFDGTDYPTVNSPDYCSVQTIGMQGSNTFYIGLGEGGVTVPGSPDATIEVLNGLTSNEEVASFAPGVTAPPATSTLDINGFHAEAMTTDGSGNSWYLTNNDMLEEMAAGAQGNAAPITTLNLGSRSAYAETGGPDSVALDAAGNIYVSYQYEIDEYAAHSSGSATPIRVINGNFVQGGDASDNFGKLIVDSAGNIWVVDFVEQHGMTGQIDEFGPAQSGHATPIGTYMAGQLASANCGVASPAVVLSETLDPQGRLIVLGNGSRGIGSSIWIYPPGFTPATCPTYFNLSVDADATSDIASDDVGFVYVLATNGDVAVYNETQPGAPNSAQTAEVLQTGFDWLPSTQGEPPQFALTTSSGWFPGQAALRRAHPGHSRH